MARKCIETVVCDRCGKEFEESPLDQASWFKPELIFMRALLSIRGKGRMIRREGIPYDFCKECAESFEDWFCDLKQKG